MPAAKQLDAEALVPHSKKTAKKGGLDFLWKAVEATFPDLFLTFRGVTRLAHLFAGDAPQVLYHYTSHSGLLGIIGQRQLWGTHIKFLNDSSEYSFAIEAATAMLAKRSRRGSKTERTFLKAVLERVREPETADVYVVCFSAFGDRLSQWRGYCPSGIGYSLGFASTALRTVAAKASFQLMRCVYKEDDQQRVLTGIVDALVQRAANAPNTKPPSDFPRNFARFLITTLATVYKHPSFEEEAEWRLVLIRKEPPPRDASPILFRSGKSTLLPYVTMPLVSDEQRLLPLQEIVVGPNPLPTLALSGARRLLATHDVPTDGLRPSTSPYRSW